MFGLPRFISRLLSRTSCWVSFDVRSVWKLQTVGGMPRFHVQHVARLDLVVDLLVVVEHAAVVDEFDVGRQLVQEDP